MENDKAITASNNVQKVIKKKKKALRALKRDENLLTRRDELLKILQKKEDDDDYLELSEKKMVKKIEKIDKIRKEIHRIDDYLKNRAFEFDDAVPDEQLLPKFPKITISDTGLQPLNDLLTCFINRPCVEDSLRVWDNYTRVEVQDVKTMLEDEKIFNCPKANDIIPNDPEKREAFIIGIVGNVSKKISHVCNDFKSEELVLMFGEEETSTSYATESVPCDTNQIKNDFDKIKKELNELPLETMEQNAEEECLAEDDDKLGDDDEVVEDENDEDKFQSSDGIADEKKSPLLISNGNSEQLLDSNLNQIPVEVINLSSDDEMDDNMENEVDESSDESMEEIVGEVVNHNIPELEQILNSDGKKDARQPEEDDDSIICLD